MSDDYKADDYTHITDLVIFKHAFFNTGDKD